MTADRLAETIWRRTMSVSPSVDWLELSPREQKRWRAVAEDVAAAASQPSPSVLHLQEQVSILSTSNALLKRELAEASGAYDDARKTIERALAARARELFDKAEDPELSVRSRHALRVRADELGVAIGRIRDMHRRPAEP